MLSHAPTEVEAPSDEEIARVLRNMRHPPTYAADVEESKRAWSGHLTRIQYVLNHCFGGRHVFRLRSLWAGWGVARLRSRLVTFSSFGAISFTRVPGMIAATCVHA